MRRWMGQKEGLGSSISRGSWKGNVRGGRAAEGEGYQGVFPSVHLNLLSVQPLRVLWFQWHEYFFLTFLFPLAALVMVLNSTSVSWSARIQIFLTFCKLVAILIIIVPGVIQLIKGMKWKVNAFKVLLSLRSPVSPHLPPPNNAYSSKIS